MTDDYSKRLAFGFEECGKVISRSLGALMTKPGEGQRKAAPPQQSFCHLSNVTECAASEGARGSFVVTLYNPLLRRVSKYVRVPVRGVETRF